MPNTLISNSDMERLFQEVKVYIYVFNYHLNYIFLILEFWSSQPLNFLLEIAIFNVFLDKRKLLKIA